MAMGLRTKRLLFAAVISAAAVRPATAEERQMSPLAPGKPAGVHTAMSRNTAGTVLLIVLGAAVLATVVVVAARS
jgi:hypothetical protein